MDASTIAQAAAPKITLGQIKARIAPLSIDAAGLAELGFPPAATEKAAKLYHEASYGSMVDAMVAQLVRSKLAQQEAA